MSKLMWIAGILLTAAGIALGLMVFASSVPVAGVNLETAAILLVGGILSIGLGGIVNAVEQRPAPLPEPVVTVEAPIAVTPIPEFGRKTAEPAAAAVMAVPASVPDDLAADELSKPTQDTIAALEQARRKIEQAFDPRPAAEAPEPVAEPPVTEEPLTPEPVAEAAPEEEAVIEEETPEEDEPLEEGQLYVIEERVIRDRPARILSDGTVEAETEEGWMRFENLEHLDEYLDAIAPAQT